MSFTIKSFKRADKNIEDIKKCLLGLTEILNIVIPDEKDALYKMAKDNISSLYRNFVHLMVNEAGSSQFMKKLLSKEIELKLEL